MTITEHHLPGRIEWQDERGRRHRADGPAVVYPDGSKEWWLEGRLSRSDGPAIEDASGWCEWWIAGRDASSSHPVLLRARREERARMRPTRTQSLKAAFTGSR